MSTATAHPPWWKRLIAKGVLVEENRPVRINSIWPDGTLISARSWHELEEKVRARQWHKMGTNEFRREMRRRCEIMTGLTVSVRSAERMFRDLETADMVRLEVREEGDSGADDG